MREVPTCKPEVIETYPIDMILSFDPTLVEPGFTVQDADGGIDFIEAWPFFIIARSPDLDPDSNAEYFACWLEAKARAVRRAALRRQFGGQIDATIV